MTDTQTNHQAVRPGVLWLTEKQAAERLNMSVKWLQKERLRGGALPFAKFGSAVRYSMADIEEFERRSFRRSTSDDGAISRSS